MRATCEERVVVVFNNDDKSAEFEFDVSRLGLRDGAMLMIVSPSAATLPFATASCVSLPKRSAAIFNRR